MKYPDHIYIRAEPGTRERVEKARKDEPQADYLRRILMERLDVDAPKEDDGK